MERICRADGIEGTCGVKRRQLTPFPQDPRRKLGNNRASVCETTVESWGSVGSNCCSGVLHEGGCKVFRLGGGWLPVSG